MSQVFLSFAGLSSFPFSFHFMHCYLCFMDKTMADTDFLEISIRYGNRFGIDDGHDHFKKPKQHWLFYVVAIQQAVIGRRWKTSYTKSIWSNGINSNTKSNLLNKKSCTLILFPFSNSLSPMDLAECSQTTYSLVLQIEQTPSMEVK